MRRIVWYTCNDSCNIYINSDISLTTMIHVQLNYILCVGNLYLNQSCIVHEQCSSSNYSRCVDEKCKCMEGYTAENLTHCIKCMLSYYLHRWTYVMHGITNAIICITMCKITSVKLISFSYKYVCVNING